MYPDLSYLFHDLFGTAPDNWISVIKTFGFFLVLAIMTASVMLMSELRRKEKQGLLSPQIVTVVKGEPASPMELLLNGIFGFLLGFKFFYVLANFADFKMDPAAVLFSGKGNWIGGIVMAALFVAFKWYEKNRERKDKPETVKVSVSPHERIGDITMVAAISGVLGAKIFAMIEDLDLVFNGSLTFGDWLSTLFSGSGMAIYGGLIGGFLVTYFYVKKMGIKPIHVMDAVAPALMIGYAVGRMGCHFSGDGDWGIPIEKVSATGEILWSYTKPAFMSFLPDWMWAYDYPHNVIGEGIAIEGCEYRYCKKLSTLVFTTPFYEIVMATILGAILWAMRKRVVIPGMLFFIYLIMNGFERFWIEKVRVNEEYNFFGIPTTQAELIATILMIIGVVGCFILWKKNKTTT